MLVCSSLVFTFFNFTVSKHDLDSLVVGLQCRPCYMSDCLTTHISEPGHHDVLLELYQAQGTPDSVVLLRFATRRAVPTLLIKTCYMSACWDIQVDLICSTLPIRLSRWSGSTLIRQIAFIHLLFHSCSTVKLWMHFLYHLFRPQGHAA